MYQHIRQTRRKKASLNKSSEVHPTLVKVAHRGVVLLNDLVEPLQEIFVRLHGTGGPVVNTLKFYFLLLGVKVVEWKVQKGILWTSVKLGNSFRPWRSVAVPWPIPMLKLRSTADHERGHLKGSPIREARGYSYNPGKKKIKVVAKW